MDRPRARPRFELDVPVPPDVVCDRVRAALAAPDAGLRGRVYRRVVQLEVPAEEAHFWSPHLDVSLAETPEGSRLFGRFAPHPHVWTGFVALQAVCWLLATAAAVYGTSQWMIREAPTALWLCGLLVLAALLAHGTAYLGQSLGQSQMYTLRAFLDRALAAPPAVEPPQG